MEANHNNNNTAVKKDEKPAVPAAPAARCKSCDRPLDIFQFPHDEAKCLDAHKPSR